MFHNFKEYHVDVTRIEERLPWGGLIHPSIVRNKDDSLMGFLSYTSAEEPASISVPFRFPNGWSFWSEKQHRVDSMVCSDHYYFSFVWNPFFNSSGQVVNTLDRSRMSRDDRISYFYNLLQKLEQIFQKRAAVQLLTNDAVLAYLRSTLTVSRPVPPAPIPLYLDALLSQDLHFSMQDDTVILDGKTIGILTPLGYLSPDILQAIFAHYHTFPYRFVRRFLFCDEKTFQKEQNRYMSQWCIGRHSMLRFIQERLQGNLFGYDTCSFLFSHEDPKQLTTIMEQAQTVMEKLGLPFIVEEFNLKDVFWGSLPGLFRANLVPPVTTADSWNEFFLCDRPEAREVHQNV